MIDRKIRVADERTETFFSTYSCMKIIIISFIFYFEFKVKIHDYNEMIKLVVVSKIEQLWW